ncbi:MAG: DUF6456 domain-containing protein [Pseudolabrys sp.]
MTMRAKSVPPGELAAPTIDQYRGQHLAVAERQITTERGRASVTVDEAESPLAWLARRRGRNGRALIEPHQLQAGERLRADFTCAHMMPRTTSNWSSPIASRRRGGERAAAFTETMMAARQRVHRALEAAGPEFGGLLLDVCCFLKGLDDRTRARLAVALGQGRAATRARPAGATLWLRGASDRPIARGDQNMAGGGRELSGRVIKPVPAPRWPRRECARPSSAGRSSAGA